MALAQKLALQWSPDNSGLAEAAVPPTDRDCGYLTKRAIAVPLCSDARRAEEGSDGTVAYKAADAHAKAHRGQEWTNAHTSILSLYPRERTRRGRGSRISWPLGRGKSSYRSRATAHRDAVRTPHSPLYDARPASKEGHDDRGLPAALDKPLAIARAATTLP